jgi:hypothetical protein
MTVKKDFMTFQKELIESGSINKNDIDEYNGRNVLLNFKKTGMVVRSEFNSTGVFPRSGDGIIDEGTWICTLEKDKNMYLASPVKKLDASFFMELKYSQKDEIINALWVDQRTVLEPYFKDLYLQEVKNMMESSVKETTEGLRREIEDLRTANRELERQIATERSISSKTTADKNPLTPQMEGFATLESAVSSGTTVKRISPEVLESPYFTHTKYFVHVSYDLKTMVIKAHDYGTVICFKNKLFLTGLDKICTFKGECELPSRYDQEKGLIVSLR